VQSRILKLEVCFAVVLVVFTTSRPSYISLNTKRDSRTQKAQREREKQVSSAGVRMIIERLIELHLISNTLRTECMQNEIVAFKAANKLKRIRFQVGERINIHTMSCQTPIFLVAECSGVAS